MAPRGTRTVRASGLFVAVVVAGVLLGGCFRATVGVEVNGDGSGSLTVEFVPGQQLRTALGGDIDALSAQLRSSADVRASGTRVVTFSGSDGPELRVEVPLSDYQDLEVVPGRQAANPVSASFLGGVVRRLDISERNGRWSMVAELDLERLDAGALGLPGGGLPGLAERPDLRLRFSLPGRVRSTNADEHRWGTAEWRIGPTARGVQRLRMVNDPLPVLPVAAGGGTLLVALVITAVLLRRRRRRRIEAALAAENAAARAAGAAAAGLAVPGAGGDVDPWGTTSSAAVEHVPSGPVESSPSPEARAPYTPAGPPAGWYPDPAGSDRVRWWDGARWTDHLA